MDVATLFLIGLGVVVLFNFVVLFMCTKTWQIVHVLIVASLFFAVITLVFFTAFALKTRQAWWRQANTLAQKLVKEEAETQRLLHGVKDESDEALQEATLRYTPSLQDRKDELFNLLLDRGRRWDSVSLGQAAGAETVTLNIVPPARTGEDAPASHHIEPNTIVYVFKEVTPPAAAWKQPLPDLEDPLKQQAWNVPGAYLGQFIVTGRTDSQITVKPRIPLTPTQQQGLATGPFTLFDVMPIDNHTIFASLDEKVLTDLLRSYNIPPEEYTRDGGPADKSQDPPARIWHRVTFTKRYEADVDAPITSPADLGLPASAFDMRGLALPAQLRQGPIPQFDEQGKPTVALDEIRQEAKTEFDVDDHALVDPETADRLLDEGVIKDDFELVFVRELRDYASYFEEIHTRRQILNTAISEAQRDTHAMDDTRTQVDSQLTYRGLEKTKLEQDLAGFQREQAAVTAYLENLETHRAALRKQLGELYTANNQLAARLAEIQLQRAAEINARTEATAAVPTIAP